MNRKNRFVLLAIMALLIVVAVNIQPARAGLTLTYIDGLDGSQWSCETYWSNVLCYVPPTVTTNQARSNRTAADLRIYDAVDQSRWVAAGRSFTITPPIGYRTSSCKVTMYVKSISYNYLLGHSIEGPGALEIIDPPTWNYITYKPFTLAQNNYDNYGPITTNWWYPTTGTGNHTFYIRLVAYPNRQNVGNVEVNSNARTWLYGDDLSVTCNFI